MPKDLSMPKEPSTDDEIQRVKYELWGHDLDTEMRDADAAKRLVAEGDSWFDYAPDLDILDQLKFRHRYSIWKVAKFGNTLEDMSWGTEIYSNYVPRPPQLLETLRAIRIYKPKVVLLSAGGNDVVGDEFESYLNHRDNGLTDLREQYADTLINDVFRPAYIHILSEIANTEAVVGHEIHVIAHGYADAIPDGRPTRTVFGVRLGGPWLRPALAHKRIPQGPGSDGETVVRDLIGKFNAMLAQLDQQSTKFHYIDLRPIITQHSHWRDELHLHGFAAARVADAFHAEISNYV